MIVSRNSRLSVHITIYLGHDLAAKFDLTPSVNKRDAFPKQGMFMPLREFFGRVFRQGL